MARKQVQLYLVTFLVKEGGDWREDGHYDTREKADNAGRALSEGCAAVRVFNWSGYAVSEWKNGKYFAY